MRIFDPPTNEEQIEAAGRVSEIIIPNSAEKRRYPRAGTVYGVTFNTVTGEHYCFNRDYVILPIQLDALPEFRGSVQPGKLHGWGPHCPIDISHWRVGDVATGFIFKDGCAPRWRHNRLAYEFAVAPGQTPANRRLAA